MDREVFNEEATYDTEIAPLITEIVRICKARGIPMLASFLFERTAEGEDGLCTTSLATPEARSSRILEVATALIRGRVEPAVVPFTVTTTRPLDKEVMPW